MISGGLLLVIALLALLALPSGAPRHKTGIQVMLTSSVELLQNLTLTSCLLATLGSCIGFGVFLTFLPLFASECGLDPARVGLVFAAQAFTNVVSRVPIGRLADRIDRRRIVTVGLFCLAVSLAALGQATQLPALLGCAVLLGLGMALTYTAIGALIADGVSPRQRGLAMGMYNSCIYLGMMTGSTAMGFALQRIGYPLGFALAGASALLASLAFARISRPAKQA